jgi:Domain of unknown function (DUF4258)
MTIHYTNHAVERMLLRRISAAMIQQAVTDPDKTEREEDGDIKHIKRIQNRTLHAIAKPLERDEWLIKTVFVRDEKDPSVLLQLLAKLAAPLLRPFIVPR